MAVVISSSYVRSIMVGRSSRAVRIHGTVSFDRCRLYYRILFHGTGAEFLLFGLFVDGAGDLVVLRALLLWGLPTGFPGRFVEGFCCCSLHW
jgi:hypothetical protein